MATPATPTAPDPNQAGWWNLRDLRGSPAGIFQAIERAGIPERWANVLRAEITAIAEQDAKRNFFYVDAHYFVEAGKANLHITIEPDTVL